MRRGQLRLERGRTARGFGIAVATGLLVLAISASAGVVPVLSTSSHGPLAGGTLEEPPLALPRPVDLPGGAGGGGGSSSSVAFPSHAVTPLIEASCDDCAYYMQEGAFLDQACFSGVTGSCTAFSGYSALYVDVQVETSPYITGFELNGVTNTGDWYQSMVGENWCADGFEVMNEVWNSAQESLSGPCVTSSLSISAGDEVQLGLYVASSGDVCFTAQDLTHPQTAFLNCVTQPDPGSTPTTNYFAYGANGGYFTGPMTEIVDPSASSCEAYTDMPTVQYQFASGAYVVDYTPWSDEWYPPTDALCYDSIGTTEFAMSPGDTTLQYVDASGGSTYGPHWQSAQNISSLSLLGWWEFTTDATLPIPVATPTSIEEGQAVDVQFSDPVVVEHVDSKATYEDWSNSLPGSWSCTPSDSDQLDTCSGTATASGTYPVELTIGETGGHSLVSPALEFTIFSGLSIVSAGAAPSSVDVGQTLLLTVDVDQGPSGLSFAWNGLPPGCVSSSTEALNCTPTAAGQYSVTVTASNASGGSVTSGAIAVTVDTDPSVTLPVATPGARETDVNLTITFTVEASGGAGSYVYSWNDLPTGCDAADLPNVTCAPAAAGSYQVSVTVTDANHYTQVGPTLAYAVYLRPTISAFVSSSTMVLSGVGTTFRVSTVGGSPPLSYAYSGLPAGCTTANTANLTCAPSATGTYRVGVEVTDSSGISASANLTVVVHPSLLGLPMAEGEAVLLGIVGAVLAIVVALVLVLRRRRSEPPGR